MYYFLRFSTLLTLKQPTEYPLKENLKRKRSYYSSLSGQDKGFPQKRLAFFFNNGSTSLRSRQQYQVTYIYMSRAAKGKFNNFSYIFWQ